MYIGNIFLTVSLLQLTSIRIRAVRLSYEEKLEAITLGKPGSDYCYNDHQTPLELIFMVDRSSDTVLDLMPNLIEIVDSLKMEYPGSKFGMTFFADFPCQAWYKVPEGIKCGEKYPDYGVVGHEDEEGCYTFKTKLSEDTEILKTNVKPGAIEQLPSGGTESGIAGLYLTVSDSQVGWTKTPAEPEINKIIVVITDDESHCCSKRYGIKNPPKGDGTDKCETMNNPNLEETSKKLVENNISLFMILKNFTIPDWEEKATKMGVNFQSISWKEPNEAILQKFRELIFDLTIEKGHVTCRDPEGYITLGL